MRPYGTSSADGEVDAVLRSEPPVDGATLNGWVTLAEWAVPGGEPMLVLKIFRKYTDRTTEV